MEYPALPDRQRLRCYGCSGRDAGQWVARLKADGAAALAEAPVQRGEGVSVQDVADALVALAVLAAA